MVLMQPCLFRKPPYSKLRSLQGCDYGLTKNLLPTRTVATVASRSCVIRLRVYGCLVTVAPASDSRTGVQRPQILTMSLLDRRGRFPWAGDGLHPAANQCGRLQWIGGSLHPAGSPDYCSVATPAVKDSNR